MKKSTMISWSMAGMMLVGALCTKAVTPTVRLADTRARVILSTAIPAKFGDWQEDMSQVAAVVNPTTLEELNKIYAETLSRTYVNQQGERIMLSIAYGTDQRDNLSVHFPEGCYGGQGFAVGETTQISLPTKAGAIAASRMVATLNNRIEPITYWVVVGDKAVPSLWEVKKVKLAYAVRGLIPDATLMRVSSIGGDTEDGYRLQQAFVDQLLQAMPANLRQHFAGTSL
ncbi:exosortase-associated protein EpsI, B-type [Janthinobacterium sp. RB2P8]|uniref:exosortase-associated protein EpsI, B-type n=1 Tax=Janthinobacterium sp. RB2P8 TaxID=3424191 RepID=UPI003F272256